MVTVHPSLPARLVSLFLEWAPLTSELVLFPSAYSTLSLLLPTCLKPAHYSGLH